MKDYGTTECLDHMIPDPNQKPTTARTKALICCLLVTFAIAGCQQQEFLADYKAKLDKAKIVLIIPLQFDEVFGAESVDHGFTIKPGRPHGERPFYSETYIYDRYRVSYHTRISIDRDGGISKSGQEKIYINEVESIIDHGGGIIEATYGKQFTLNPDEWEKVYRAEDDFEAAGVQLRKKDPLPKFGDYVKAWREDRKPLQ